MAFTLPKGAISAPMNAGQAGVVLSVTDKQEPTADDIAKHMDQTREQLLAQQQDEIFRVYIGTLMDTYQKKGGDPVLAEAAGSGLVAVRRVGFAGLIS